MKTLLLIASIALTLQHSFAQLAFNEKDIFHGERIYSDVPLKTASVPEQVKEMWQKNYSIVKGEQWYQTTNGYMACYDYRDFQSRVLYDAGGNVVMHSREVDPNKLPLAILNFMKKNYPGMPLAKAYMNYPVAGQNLY